MHGFRSARAALGAIVALFALCFAGGCSPSRDWEAEAGNSIYAFFEAYDSYATAGYPETLPERLDVMVAAEARETVIDDGLWWRSREYHQAGETQVVSLEVVEADSSQAIVEVVVDTSAIRILSSDGQVVSEGNNAAQVIRFALAREGNWQVTSMEAA